MSEPKSKNRGPTIRILRGDQKMQAAVWMVALGNAALLIGPLTVDSDFKNFFS
jgi:hypothetical protein